MARWSQQAPFFVPLAPDFLRELDASYLSEPESDSEDGGEDGGEAQAAASAAASAAAAQAAALAAAQAAARVAAVAAEADGMAVWRASRAGRATRRSGVVEHPLVSLLTGGAAALGMVGIHRPADLPAGIGTLHQALEVSGPGLELVVRDCRRLGSGAIEWSCELFVGQGPGREPFFGSGLTERSRPSHLVLGWDPVASPAEIEVVHIGAGQAGDAERRAGLGTAALFAVACWAGARLLPYGVERLVVRTFRGGEARRWWGARLYRGSGMPVDQDYGLELLGDAWLHRFGGHGYSPRP
jgi:hypothetical protein